MAKVTIHATRNHHQLFAIEFEYPAYSLVKPDTRFIKITGMTGHPEYVDPEEWFTAMKTLLKEAKAEIKAQKGVEE